MAKCQKNEKMDFFPWGLKRKENTKKENTKKSKVLGKSDIATER